MNVNLFARITKVDEAKREVWGRLVQETPDRADEIFDYESSKPHFKAWSEDFAKTTSAAGQEVSFGNMRAMHGKVAAGKFTSVEFNDSEKAIDVCGKVVDDQEWKKVLEGVYTGYSIGGSYVGEKKAEKLGDKTLQRYTAKPTEGSLVDSPCVPTATFFEIRKADGAIEKVAFKAPALEVRGTDDEVAAFAKALNDSNMTLADALTLVKAESAVRAEKALIEADDELIKGALAKPLIESDSDEARDKNIAAEIKAGKSPEQASAIAYAVQRKAKRGKGKAMPTEIEKDFAEMLAYVGLKKRLDDPALTLVDFLSIAQEQLGEEEARKIASGDDLAKAKTAILAKQKMSAAHHDRVQAIHDHAASMGADCDNDTDKTAKNGDLAKGGDLAKQLADAMDRIAKLEKQPAPHVVSLRVVEKGDVGSTQTVDKLASTPYDQLVKRGDGTIDWAASEHKITQGAAA